MDLGGIQRERLERRAAKHGRYRELLYYLAASRDIASLRATAARAEGVDTEAELASAVLTLAFEPNAWPHLLERADDLWGVWERYTFTKFLLSRNDVTNALRVAKSALAHDKFDTVCLNLTAKYLAHAREPDLARRVISQSLRLNPYQMDMTCLEAHLEHGTPPAVHLYLDVLPMAASVSAYAPVYNAQERLEATLDALLGQSQPLNRIVIVDDGSTDESAAIAAAYPVRLIRKSENKGLAAARNTAFRAIEAPFVASVDADVAAAPDYVQSAMMPFENASPQLAGVGGRLIEAYRDTPADFWRSRHLSQDQGAARIYMAPAHCFEPAIEDPLPYFFITGSNTLLRSQAVLDAGMYNEKYRTNKEDVSLCYELKARGFHYAFEPCAVAHHHKRDTTASVLRTAWNFSFWSRQESGVYDTAAGIVAKLEEHREFAQARIQEDFGTGHHACLYIDLLWLFYFLFLDIRYGAEQKVLGAEESMWMQTQLLAALSPLDARFGGDLRGRIVTDVRALLTSPHEAPAPAGVPWRSAFEQFISRARADFTSYPEALYQGVLDAPTTPSP